MNDKEQIRHLEDLFFDTKSPGYADINLFSGIFKILDTQYNNN